MSFGPDEVAGYVECRDEFSADDLVSRWWSPKEFQAIRLSAKLSCKNILKEEGGRLLNEFDRNVSKFFELVDNLANDSDALQGILDDPTHQSKPFERWSCHHICCRGLEKYSSVVMKESRRENIIEATSSVLHYQDQLATDDLATLYRTKSTKAVLFARVTGHIDAITLANGKLESIAEEKSSSERPRLAKELSRGQLLIRQRSLRKINPFDLA